MAVFLCAGTRVVEARTGGPFGMGLVLGEPTGLTAKYWVSPTGAFDFAAAWSFGPRDSMYLHASYLVHDFGLIQVKNEKFGLYYGIGARLVFADPARFGARVPLGISYELKRHPLEFFLELGPIVDLVPETELDLTGGVGARYYF